MSLVSSSHISHRSSPTSSVQINASFIKNKLPTRSLGSRMPTCLCGAPQNTEVSLVGAQIPTRMATRSFAALQVSHVQERYIFCRLAHADQIWLDMKC